PSLICRAAAHRDLHSFPTRRSSDLSAWLHEDLKLKRALKERLRTAGISSIEIDRMANKLRVSIRTARPGIIIGRKGSEIDKLKRSEEHTSELQSLTNLVCRLLL